MQNNWFATIATLRPSGGICAEFHPISHTLNLSLLFFILVQK